MSSERSLRDWCCHSGPILLKNMIETSLESPSSSRKPNESRPDETPKAYLKLINHVLVTMLDLSYVHFMPRAEEALPMGADLDQATLPSSESFRVLKFAPRVMFA